MGFESVQELKICESPHCELLELLEKMGHQFSHSRGSDFVLVGLVPLINRIIGSHTWGIFLAATPDDKFKLTAGCGDWQTEAWAKELPGTLIRSLCQDRRNVVNDADGLISEDFQLLVARPASGLIGVPIWHMGGFGGALLVLPTTEAVRKMSPVRLQALDVLSETLGLAFGDSLAKSWRAKAFHDPLTGVLNRRGFDYWYRRWISAAQKGVHQFCLVLVDLDRFKQINDVYGHPVGDQVLKTLAHLLEQQKRLGDRVARLGGDEFALLLADVDASVAQEISGRLKELVRSFPIAMGTNRTPIHCDFSFGIGSSDGSRSEATPIFDQADADLYRRKTIGREGSLGA